jgi:hypothetical protein
LFTPATAFSGAIAANAELLILPGHLGVAGQSVQTVFASEETVKPE